jgi:hypothetical protein
MHPVAVQLMEDYRRLGGRQPLPKKLFGKWNRRVAQTPAEDKIKLALHIGILAGRVNHLFKEEGRAVVIQLLALVATVVGKTALAAMSTDQVQDGVEGKGGRAAKTSAQQMSPSAGPAACLAPPKRK